MSAIEAHLARAIFSTPGQVVSGSICTCSVALVIITAIGCLGDYSGVTAIVGFSVGGGGAIAFFILTCYSCYRKRSINQLERKLEKLASEALELEIHALQEREKKALDSLTLLAQQMVPLDGRNTSKFKYMDARSGCREY